MFYRPYQIENLLVLFSQHVAILDVDVTNGKELEEKINNKYGPGTTKFYKCDVTSQDLADVYDEIIKSYGYIDVVVNNAGIMNDSPRLYEKQIAINLVST